MVTVILNDVEIPPKSFNSLQVFMHLWHHFSIQGIGLRQFVDLAMILHKDHEAIDTPEFLSYLQKLGRVKPWQMIGCVLVNHLGFPEEEFPFYNAKYKSQAAQILQITLEEGNFGNKKYGTTANSSLLKRKMHSFSVLCQRLVSLHKVSPALPWEMLFRMIYRVRYVFS